MKHFVRSGITSVVKVGIITSFPSTTYEFSVSFTYHWNSPFCWQKKCWLGAYIVGCSMRALPDSIVAHGSTDSCPGGRQTLRWRSADRCTTGHWAHMHHWPWSPIAHKCHCNDYASARSLSPPTLRAPTMQWKASCCSVSIRRKTIYTYRQVWVRKTEEWRFFYIRTILFTIYECFVFKPRALSYRPQFLFPHHAEKKKTESKDYYYSSEHIAHQCDPFCIHLQWPIFFKVALCELPKFVWTNIRVR